MNDDYNIGNDGLEDDNLNQENIPAIDGQIGIEELFIREDEHANEDENAFIPPMDNQVSLDEFFANLEVLKNKDDILNNDNLGIFNNKPVENLADFFKDSNNLQEENDSQKQKENSLELNKNSKENNILPISDNEKKIANLTSNNVENNGNENNDEDDDDYQSPQGISKSLNNFYGENNSYLDSVLTDDINEESEEDNSGIDQEDSNKKQDRKEENEFGSLTENGATSVKKPNLSLEKPLSASKTYFNEHNSEISYSNFNNSNNTEKEEGLSNLEDDNNYNNNNNMNNNYFGNDNYNNENNQDNYNAESNQNYEDNLSSNGNYSAENYGENGEQNYNNGFTDNQNNQPNNEDNNGVNVSTFYNDENNNQLENNELETINNYNDNNNQNNFENDNLYGGNASAEDTMFSQPNNEADEENNFDNNIDNNDDYDDINNPNDNAIDSYVDNDTENYNNNNIISDDDSNNTNNDNDNNTDNINNSDDNFDDTGKTDYIEQTDSSIETENIEDNKTFNNTLNETFENANLIKEQNNSLNSNAKDNLDNLNDDTKFVEKQRTAKNNKQKNNYFENEENLKVIEDVDAINKDYEEVNLVVGKDAFADYEDSSLITNNIQETDVVDIKEKVYNENDGQDVVDGMLYKNLDTVLHESMIPYSEHVILDRALPRVEDGLKPVQRRILYSMLELGVTPDKPFRKSARIVGDCLGKYHPHGDSSVYDAMVRMAQPFNTNMLLVSGHGNFGSVDGDGAAAMRYTEARLAPISMELLRDLDKNTVKWCLNFDDTLKEPEILPGRFPNLLVNGATGIAVGLATNIPPHNLAETIDGVIAYLNNPSISLKEMLKIIKGPDFPTGAYILNTSELMQAYQTGRGKIYMRAKMHIESNGADKSYIVITELPYQVNKSSLLQKIANFKDEDKFGFGGISEVRDESDREGLRAVLRLKKDADIKTIYKSLLKNTELQTTFGINMVAIANGKPKQMGLLDIISYYAEYQREIIFRRSKYELEQAKEREHILTGLIIAIKNIDAVVKIIKTSQNTTEAKKRLKEKFSLSDRQAQAILDMRLAKLTSLEVYKLEEELKRLRELIKKLTAIIASKKLQKEIVKDELSQIKRQYKQERKTKFAKQEEEIAAAPQPKEDNQKVVILKSAQNNFKCVALKQYNYAQKEVTDNSTLSDTHILKFETETSNTLIAFSSLGNCFKVDVREFSQSRYRDKGVPEKAIFKELGENETIVALFNYANTSKEGNLIFLTKYGMIKKTPFTEYALLKRYYQGMKLKDDDEIIQVTEEPKAYSYIFVTKQGMVLNATNDDVPVQGRISGGVKGINLATNDYCVGVGLAGDGGEILAITNKGYTKRVLISNVDKSARYRKGLKFFTFTGDNGRELVFAGVVTNAYTLGCVDNEGDFHYRNTDHIPIENRTGKGKPVEKMKKSLSIIKAFAINN